jgi:hypothetical protein
LVHGAARVIAAKKSRGIEAPLGVGRAQAICTGYVKSGGIGGDESHGRAVLSRWAWMRDDSAVVDTMEVVEAWDRSLRSGDWDTARALLFDHATYVAIQPAPPEATCATADEIIEMMRSFKGEVPDVEVVAWGVVGTCVVAWLRQPAFIPRSDWYQVIAVRDGRIASLADYPTREEAAAAALASAA